MTSSTVGQVTLYTGDVAEWAAEYDGPPFHSLLADPPYHLTNIRIDVMGCEACGRQLGGADGKPKVCPRCGGRLGRQRKAGSAGFMGKEWDGGDVAFRPETWAALAKHLLPGGYLMAFGGASTFHRLACAIEDAGFELAESIGWVHLQGFPKNQDISKKIDEAAGATREVTGTTGRCIGPSQNQGFQNSSTFKEENWETSNQATAPATPEAATWSGFGTSTKPAIEAIVCARKPHAAITSEALHARTGWDHWCHISPAREYGKGATRQTCRALHPHAASYAVVRDKAGNELAREDLGPYAPFKVDTIAANALLHGSGALNIDAGRVPVKAGDLEEYGLDGDEGSPTDLVYGERERVPYQRSDLGRWPANLYLSQEAAELLDRQSGETVSTGGQSSQMSGFGEFGGGSRTITKEDPGFGDTGGASRMFHVIDTRLDECDPLIYCPKAGTFEKEAGLDDFDPQPAGGHLAQADGQRMGRDAAEGANTRQRPKRRNGHPCAKPIALTTKLAALILPPAEYAPRRCLIPFGGVASEAIGAIIAGFEEVVTIEQDPEYVAVAAARLAWWQEQTKWLEPNTQPDPAAILAAARTKPANSAQPSLFDEDDQ